MASIIQTANPAGVTATSNVATYSAQSIGIAAPNRIIVVAVAVELASATPSGCTIDYGLGDTAMTAAPSGAGNFGAVYTQLYYLKVPTGTTATIKVTYSATNPTNLQNHIAVYRVLGVKYSSSGNDGSTDMDATDPLTTGSITIPSGGVFIAVAGGATDGTGKTWANATEDIDADAGSLRFTTAIRDTALTTTAVTCTGGTNGEDGALSYIIFAADVAPTVSLNTPIDTVANSGVIASDNEYSFNITIASNNDRFLVVAVASRDNDNPTNRPVTGITADGVAMTLMESRSMTDGDGDDTRVEIWGLENPNTGTISIVVTHTGTVDHAGATAVSAYNIKQSTTPNTTGFDEDTQSSATTHPSIDLTTTANACLLIDVGYHQDGANLTAGSGQTVIAQLGTNGGGDRIFSSYKFANDSGVNNIAWTAGTMDAFVQVAVALEITTSDTTPTLDFTGTDTESNDVTYQIQIDTVNTFDSQSPSIEVGNVTAGSVSTGAGPFTVSHNNNKEDVYVFVAVRDDANNTLSVKYGGVDMTSIGNHTVTAGSVLEAQIFYLANAPIGANEVLVSTSGSIGDVLGFGAISTKNAAQTSPVEATTTGGETPGVEDPRSTSVTTLTTNGLVIDAISDRSAGLTVGGSSTQIFKLGSGDNMAASYRLPTSTGAYAMEWDPTENTEDWAQVVLAIKKAGRPLLSKFSHLDLGFANPDTGGDTDPFNSGENIQFTVQGGDALAVDTYYWRVRAIDPSGSNSWGAWSSTRSFTITAGGAAYEQDCNEVITLVDVIRKKPTRVLGEITTLVDTIRKSESRIIVEAITLVDTVKRTTSRALSEIVSLVDTIRKLPTKVQAEVVTLVDTFSGIWTAHKSLSEIITLVDVVLKKPIKVLIESFSLVDTIRKAQSTVKAEVLTLVDTFSRVLTAIRTLGETITFVDTVRKLPSRVLVEVVSLIDRLSKLPSRVLGEILVLVDTLIKAWSTFRAFAEIITLVDTPAFFKGVLRSFSETFTLTDTISRVTSRIINATITLVDSISRSLIYLKTLLESITLVDTLVCRVLDLWNKLTRSESQETTYTAKTPVSAGEWNKTSLTQTGTTTPTTKPDVTPDPWTKIGKN